MQQLNFIYKGYTGVKTPDGLWVIITPSKRVSYAVDSISLALSFIDKSRKSIKGELWTK